MHHTNLWSTKLFLSDWRFALYLHFPYLRFPSLQNALFRTCLFCNCVFQYLRFQRTQDVLLLKKGRKSKRSQQSQVSILIPYSSLLSKEVLHAGVYSTGKFALHLCGSDRHRNLPRAVMSVYFGSSRCLTPPHLCCLRSAFTCTLLTTYESFMYTTVRVLGLRLVWRSVW